jgi:hypothetical protein
MTNTEMMIESAALAADMSGNSRQVSKIEGTKFNEDEHAAAVAANSLSLHSFRVWNEQQEPTRGSFIPDEGYWIIDQHWVNVTQEHYVDKGELTPEEALELAITGGYVGYSSE